MYDFDAPFVLLARRFFRHEGGGVRESVGLHNANQYKRTNVGEQILEAIWQRQQWACSQTRAQSSE